MKLATRLIIAKYSVVCVAVLSMLAFTGVGCGYGDSFRKLHLAYNQQDWSRVTEHFADMGRPGDLDGVTYARAADAATRVYQSTGSKAYRELALQCYDLAAASDPALADGHYYAKAELLRKEKNHAAALTAYLDALRVNPRHVSAATWAIWLLLDEKRPADAVEAGRGLLEARGPINSILLHGLVNLAQAEARQGSRNGAVNVLQHAWALGPAAWQPEILYGRARCSATLGDYDRACTAMHGALAALPADSELRPTDDNDHRQCHASDDTPISPPRHQGPQRDVATDAPVVRSEPSQRT